MVCLDVDGTLVDQTLGEEEDAGTPQPGLPTGQAGGPAAARRASREQFAYGDGASLGWYDCPNTSAVNAARTTRARFMVVGSYLVLESDLEESALAAGLVSPADLPSPEAAESVFLQLFL